LTSCFRGHADALLLVTLADDNRCIFSSTPSTGTRFEQLEDMVDMVKIVYWLTAAPAVV
jgi:hypothetical protein